jgi:hypothetical protein
MQNALLILICILALLLYKLLSSKKINFVYIRTTHKEYNNKNTVSFISSNEKGLITIDKHIVIVEDEEYSLIEYKNNPTEAELLIENNRLINIKVKLRDGEKVYFIDPENNFFNLQKENFHVKKEHCQYLI